MNDKGMTRRNGILAIGNLLIDRTLLVAEYPQESMLTTISDVGIHCGGGCTNTLFNLAKLDPQLPLYLAGAIGKDPEGAMILEQAVAHHVNIDDVIRFDNKTSFTDVIINQQTGDRTFFHYIGVMQEYDQQHILVIDNSAKIVHFAYLPLLPGLLKNPPSVLIELFLELNRKGFLISIDLVSVTEPSIFSDYIIPILPYTDFVIINDVEAKILTNNQEWDSSEGNLRQIAQQIISTGVKNCVVIHSPELAVAISHTEAVITVPSFWVEKHEVLSTLGAGDAFCSGVLYGLHHNLALHEVLKLGHALAYFNLFSLSATDGAVSYAEVESFLKKHSF